MESMSDLKWYFPESGTECLDLFKTGFQPHGGGTHLIKTPLNVEGIFDTSRVNEYKVLEKTKSSVVIGSAVSYTEASDYVEKIHPLNIFSAALSRAASTPLRNRITIGGSIAASPGWSDIRGALAATGARVSFEGHDDTVAYSEYAKDRRLRKTELVSSIIIPKENLGGRYYRFTLTTFDYPFFTISVSFLPKQTFRCAVSGTKDELNLFTGKQDEILEAADDTIAFNNERGLSGNYLKTRAMTELKRILTERGGIDG